MGRAGASLAASLLIVLAGCASVPEATPERDAEAKQFEANPGAATLYVFRNDSRATPTTEDSVLYVNDRLIGATLPGTYFRVDLLAGEHDLHGYGYDQGSLRVRAGLGEVHFVALNVIGGTSRYTRVAPEAGRREIARCCVLMENWQEGQRPLLR
jgi:hypothetical protein